MVMSINARKAFDKLEALGATVMDWGVKEGYSEGVAFVLIWANNDTTEVFADMSGKHIREEYRYGRYINPFDFRQDVHEILAKYDLVTEWANLGQVCVYDDPNASGLKHAEKYMTRDQ